MHQNHHAQQDDFAAVALSVRHPLHLLLQVDKTLEPFLNFVTHYLAHPGKSQPIP